MPFGVNGAALAALGEIVVPLDGVPAEEAPLLDGAAKVGVKVGESTLRRFFRLENDISSQFFGPTRKCSNSRAGRTYLLEVGIHLSCVLVAWGHD